jgi:hypothetical protein
VNDPASSLRSEPCEVAAFNRNGRPLSFGTRGRFHRNAHVDALNPQRAYWARLEEPFYGLLRDLPSDAGVAFAHWTDRAAAEASRAFGEACRALGTSARALRAIATESSYFGSDTQREAVAAAGGSHTENERG